MPITPVSAENDITGGPGCHLLMMTFAPDLIECSAPMNWLPGKAASSHRLTSNVRFNGQAIVLDGHDVGPGLMHGPAADPWRSARSTRKTVYAASAVKANGIPMACVDEGHWMMTCGDPISLPSGFNFTNAAHNLMIGMSFLDDLKGQVAIACSVITDVITLCVRRPGDPRAKNPFADGDRVTQQFLGVNLEKGIVGAVVGAVGSVVVSAASDWKEPVTFTFKQGNTYETVEDSVKYYPRDGKVSVGGKSRGIWGEHKGEMGAAVPTSEARDHHPAWGGKL